MRRRNIGQCLQWQKGKLISRCPPLGPTTQIAASFSSDASLGRFPNASLDRRVSDCRFALRHSRVRMYYAPARRLICCRRLLSKGVCAYLRQERKILVTVSEFSLRMQGRSQGCFLPISSILAFRGVPLIAQVHEALG
jgi:hypothetical protein